MTTTYAPPPGPLPTRYNPPLGPPPAVYYPPQLKPDKAQFINRDANAQGSEEGWSRVVGEKELLTLRRSGATCPDQLEHSARSLWLECGQMMTDVVRDIEQKSIDNTESNQEEMGKGRLVAEPHRDLGLLSLVIRSSPGLEVWDTTSTDDDQQYRYSLVFALRPHSSATISTRVLTSPVTGPFGHPLEGVRAGDLFSKIA
ncbi:hypothetical protein Clacol_004631 [Clathrus columnatus]|uniref:Clavaminate synthase-like protein n=1 Tax=Clathrus columnatus TaxID=1419009 RepID=A0AAV5AEM4_9AGAM|nr:hypothetical protein Clacol_004631 [Clathrus columnatus]